jgi:hypothetical protein
MSKSPFSPADAAVYLEDALAQVRFLDGWLDDHPRLADRLNDLEERIVALIDDCREAA